MIFTLLFNLLHVSETLMWNMFTYNRREGKNSLLTASTRRAGHCPAARVDGDAPGHEGRLGSLTLPMMHRHSAKMKRGGFFSAGHPVAANSPLSIPKLSTGFRVSRNLRNSLQ